MKEPRKHHYVPRSYLKFFSLKKDKSNYIINVWDKKIEISCPYFSDSFLIDYTENAM